MIGAAYRLAAGLVYPAALRLRLGRGKEDPVRLPERRGVPGLPRPDGRLAWVHGASVGETSSVLALIDRMLEARADLAVLVTSGTRAAAELMARRLPHRALHQYAPLDAPSYVRRFLDHWRPDLGLFVESELWPTMLGESTARGVPLALVNGRLSARSAGRWARVPGLARQVFGAFRLGLAQEEESAARLRAAGLVKVETLGNLKFAAPPLPVDADALASLRAAIGSRPVWLAASTHKGEEAIVLTAHRALARRWPDLLTIIVPRHPTRAAEVMAEARDLSMAMRSRGVAPGSGDAVYLADTLGELGTFYALCPIVLVGGSLLPIGGHNPLEPAAFGAALLRGPDMSKNTELAARLTGVCRVVTGPEDLADAVASLLGDPAKMALMGAEARAVATADQAILARTAAAVLALLPPPAD